MANIWYHNTLCSQLTPVTHHTFCFSHQVSMQPTPCPRQLLSTKWAGMSADTHLLSLPERVVVRFPRWWIYSIWNMRWLLFYGNTKLPPEHWECSSHLGLPFALLPLGSYLSTGPCSDSKIDQIQMKPQSVSDTVLMTQEAWAPALCMLSLTSTH